MQLWNTLIWLGYTNKIDRLRPWVPSFQPNLNFLLVFNGLVFSYSSCSYRSVPCFWKVLLPNRIYYWNHFCLIFPFFYDLLTFPALFFVRDMFVTMFKLHLSLHSFAQPLCTVKTSLQFYWSVMKLIRLENSTDIIFIFFSCLLISHNSILRTIWCEDLYSIFANWGRIMHWRSGRMVSFWNNHDVAPMLSAPKRTWG